MAATIKIKNSSTAGAAPTSSDLVQGELAVNVTDKRLYTENASGTIVELGTNPSVPVTFPDGSASAPSLTNDGDTNTGLFFPAADTIALTTGGTERMRLDSSGNLGLGVTPSAWGSAWKAMQISTFASFGGNNDDKLTAIGNNYYNDGSAKYIGTGQAALYSQYQGAHRWSTAASGTAGNAISFTQAMTLTADGNLGIGTTNPGTIRLELSGAAAGASFNAFRIGNTDTTASSPVTMFFLSADDGTARNRATISSASDGSNSGYLSFSTRSSGSIAERARIDASGNLLVGTTSTDIWTGSATNTGFKVEPNGTVTAARSGFAALLIKRTTASTGDLVSFAYGTSVVGTIGTNGSTTSYNTSSDYRLKENIQPMQNALATVTQLKPCTYNWKVDGSEGQGFIAHELQEIVPDCVTGEKDAVETYTDEEGNEQTRPVYQGIDTSFLVATLTAAIQEQQAIITQLQADVAALKG